MTTEQPTSVLENLVRVQEIDTRNMLRLINELPEQCETALGVGRSFSLGESFEPPSLVYLSGVGDSGTAADMAVAAINEYVNLPVINGHGAPLPKYVGETALVLVIDYAGKSASALRVYKEAKQRGCTVVCITSGGKLHEAASKDGTKILRIPPGQPSRTAIGYLFVPLVAIFEQLGLAAGVIEKLSFGIMLMKNVREAFRIDTKTERNTAKQIALGLPGKCVVVCGARDYRSAVASRWESQLNANSKTPVCTSYFPDMVDGNISGWERAEEFASKMVFVLLKDTQDRTEVPALMDAAKYVLADFQVIEAEMKGASTVERLMYGAYLADYVSYYLALLNEVNPTNMEFVSRVEALLAGDDPEEATPQESQPE